jgi:hypothetical protein
MTRSEFTGLGGSMREAISTARRSRPAGFLVALWLVAAPGPARAAGPVGMGVGAFAPSAVLALLTVGLTAPAPAPPSRQPPHPSRARLWAQNVGGRLARLPGWRTAVIAWA